MRRSSLVALASAAVFSPPAWLSALATPPIQVLLDMDTGTPGIQSVVRVAPGTRFVGNVGVYVFDPQPANLHDDRIRHIPDGQLYATISNGVRNMPGYAAQIPVSDRWAIVSYVRALQLSQINTGATP